MEELVVGTKAASVVGKYAYIWTAYGRAVVKILDGGDYSTSVDINSKDFSCFIVEDGEVLLGEISFPAVLPRKDVKVRINKTDAMADYIASLEKERDRLRVSLAGVMDLIDIAYEALRDEYK